ncbi:hypothetical protein AHiyo8_38030 [Arthrobacter sp. Hiyo8]|nr:hypothetical protein AHiyo8_38030 [Arthrobacter sp. Hiyo8]
MAYWVRSLVPRDAKPTCRRTDAEVNAAEGTSTITPGVLIPAASHIDAKWAASAAVEIMGAMTHTSASVSSAAMAMASSWRSKTPGVVKSVR